VPLTGSQAKRGTPERTVPALGAHTVTPAFLVGLVALVYGQAGAFDFVNLDDQQYVTANPYVLRGLGWDGVAWAFGGFAAANWHPLTWLSHMADVTLFGVEAGAHHLVNVALHAANAVLLFTFLWRATGARWRSAIVAALFAVHPLHVESVAWISERKDVLSGLLFFLVLHAWLAYVRRPCTRRYVAVAALLALGLLAKPMLVTLPLVLLLVDVWPLGRLQAAPATVERRRLLARLVAEKLPLLALAAAAAVVTWLAQAAGGATAAAEAILLGGRAANALVSYVLYVARTFWPSGLAAFYPHPILAQIAVPAWKVAGAAAVLAAITVALVRERTRRPQLLWGWLWFAGMLVPVIGLAQVGEQALADRYTYLPHVGLFVAIVWAAAEVLERLRAPRAIGWVAAALPIVLLTGAAHRQAATWRDSLTLHARALEVTERNWNAWNGLGDALSDAGRPQEAIPAYREALGIRPRLASAWNGLGSAHGMLGAHAEAIPPLEEALRLRPDYADAWYNLGTAHGSLGEHARAAECFRAALRIRADHADTWANLGIASVLAQDRRGAAQSLEALYRLDPARARQLQALLEATAAR
jgi:tetratricopeptide (TPR) repeat protein